MRGGGVRAQVSVLSSYTGEGGDADAGRQRGEETTRARLRALQREHTAAWQWQRNRGRGAGARPAAADRRAARGAPTTVQSPNAVC